MILILELEIFPFDSWQNSHAKYMGVQKLYSWIWIFANMQAGVWTQTIGVSTPSFIQGLTVMILQCFYVLN